MTIQTIDIKGLYGKFDFHWNLAQNVNILAGRNGSFKSTILNVLRTLLDGKIPLDYYNLNSVEIGFNEGYTLFYRDVRDSLLNIQKMAEEDDAIHELVDRISPDYQGKDEKQLSSNYIHATITYTLKDGERVDHKGFLKKVNSNFVSTFDRPIEEDDEKGKSKLDIALDKLQSEYAYYLSDLSKQLTNLISKNNNSINSSDIANIYTKRNMFLNTIDKSFESTGKKINRDNSKISFITDDGSDLDTTNLSSGEKQLLIILLTVLCERDAKFILMMDEPEISLHLEWQKTLIGDVLSLNPNCQIILTTHSPGIIFNGWENYVSETSDITTAK
jgi:predicted ATP-dependent endonuclease of OLD family